MEDKTKEYVGGVKINFTGNHIELEKWAIPLISELEDEFENSEWEENQAPKSFRLSRTGKPTNHGAEPAIYIEVVVWLTLQLGAWVVKKGYDYAVPQLIKAIRSQLTNKGFSKLIGINFRYPDGPVVTLEAKVETEQDLAHLEAAIPEAHRRAAARFESDRTSSQTFNYKVKGVKLTDETVL